MTVLIARKASRYTRFAATYNAATGRIEFVAGFSHSWGPRSGIPLNRHSVSADTDLKGINAYWSGFVRNITVTGRAPRITRDALKKAMAAKSPSAA